MKKMMSSRKHIPQRTCVACGKVMAKRQLVRLVRTADNQIGIDSTGKSTGRGAYLCLAPECWENGLKGNRLEYTLRTNISPDNRERLIKYAEDLTQGVN
ncbi:RNase P modulator RnpM [Chloroflexota bacterium]